MSAGLYDVTGGEDIGDCTSETLQIGFSSCYYLGVMSGVQPFQVEPTFPPGEEPTDSEEESQEGDAEVNLSDRIGNTDWCSCGGNCVAMLTDHESFCCQELELNQKFDESGLFSFV